MLTVKNVTQDISRGVQYLSKNVRYGRGVGELVSVMDNSSKLGKVKNVCQGIFSTSVQPIAKSIVKDVTGIKNLPADLTNAYKMGKEASSATNKGVIMPALKILKSVYCKGLKPHLAGLLGGLGTVLPVPLSQPILYCVGKILQYIA